MLNSRTWREEEQKVGLDTRTAARRTDCGRTAMVLRCFWPSPGFEEGVLGVYVRSGS